MRICCHGLARPFFNAKQNQCPSPLESGGERVPSLRLLGSLRDDRCVVQNPYNAIELGSRILGSTCQVGYGMQLSSKWKVLCACLVGFHSWL